MNARRSLIEICELCFKEFVDEWQQKGGEEGIMCDECYKDHIGEHDRIEYK